MNLLLDTCTFLWLVQGPARIPERIRKEIADPGNRVRLSSVSAWEIAVKAAKGTLKLSAPSDQFVPASRTALDVDELPLTEAATLWLPRLPKLHADPFDRMLICQAMHGGMILVTNDEQIQRYPVRTLW